MNESCRMLHCNTLQTSMVNLLTPRKVLHLQQHTATVHYNSTLQQHTAIAHCNITLQHTVDFNGQRAHSSEGAALYCNIILQCAVAVCCCSVLLQYADLKGQLAHSSKGATVCCCVLWQCAIAVCGCSVQLQCVAVPVKMALQTSRVDLLTPPKV